MEKKIKQCESFQKLNQWENELYSLLDLDGITFRKSLDILRLIKQRRRYLTELRVLEMKIDWLKTYGCQE